MHSSERLGLLVESEAVKSISQVMCVVVCCSMLQCVARLGLLVMLEAVKKHVANHVCCPLV